MQSSSHPSVIDASRKFGKSPESEHIVQFYESEEFLHEVVARFLGDGLTAGAPVLVFATQPNRQAFNVRLESNGFDVESLCAAGKITLLDARETLSKFLVDGMPDRALFESVVGGVIEGILAGGCQARLLAYGEMVDLLWKDGSPDAAIYLEELWNELGSRHSFSLLCAYVMGNFYNEACTQKFHRICEAHNHVIPTERYSWNEDQSVQLREITLLQQRSRALESEIEHRRKLEDALRDALRERRRAEEAQRSVQQELKALYEGESSARRQAEDAQRRAAFLADASAILSSSLEYETTLASVANLAVPRIADWCLVELADDPEISSRQLAVSHVDPSKVDLVHAYRRNFPPQPDASAGVSSVIRTGKSELYEDITDEMLESAGLDPKQVQMLRELGLTSSVVVPMTTRGRMLGAFALMSADPNRHFGQADLAMAEELGRRAASAIDNARLYQEAREADRRKDEFLALLGHELRNPLAPILTALQVMKLRGFEGGREQTIVEHQARHLARLVDDLLDVSRITKGKVELKKEPVELASVLATAAEAASPLYEQRSHALSFDVPRKGLLVDADPGRLVQVLSNLLTNAAKYTDPAGEIVVAARREGDQVVVSVKDNGMGIPPELLPKMFELFAQADRALDRSQGGLGIGLTLARRLVELHGGTLTAHSEGVGMGSEFVVRLPALVESTAQQPPREEGVAATSRCSGLRILVVDDNRDLTEMYAEGLRRCGHEIAIAHDGPEALAIAARFRPNTGLLDIGLPVIDGYELAKRLRALLPDVPLRLIALTGYGQAKDKIKALEAGFDHHLVKPVDFGFLSELLSRPSSEPQTSEPRT